ncbi:phosphoadenosine phosphosulfate reductase family protein [Marinoscillum furvescens]|uniref:Phosphoadenosine phosphosulfate reductase family protein n=1 Tax=Marinoscillum furvescens DSM 4134 TaxID=1122208 RepID=A0A3D9L701_MARFU|nr:phosphoadenosine phosphosulfate reductase family protein [Marinoscillum furvescens]REE01128.1 phosphoadenosine phosphosulfate reductase family protein [Marinoscillum furvescens DSM 4134]
MKLHEYDMIIINSSGGKDSLCALWEVCRQAREQKFPFDRIAVSHQDLGDMEWPGTKDLVKQQADLFGLKTYYSKRRTKDGYEENLLEYVERRGKWPSNGQRYCTSDFKRGPGGRVVTALTKALGKCKVLYVFGFRRDESPSRSKKPVLKLNDKLTTKKRTVHDWLPIHHWSNERVWATINTHRLPYHPAYDLGMPRLSCCFCIFSPFDALVVAGKANPHLLDRYCATEKKIGHTFRNGFAINEVKEAIANDYQPETIDDWVM